MKLIPFLMGVCVALSAAADEGVRLVTDRSLELTGFQDHGGYNPETDFRNDFAMVYGADNPKLAEQIQSWTEMGYVPQMMTGIAWGQYADFRDMNGNDIMSLIQVENNGRDKGHGYRTPYIVPSIEFADYMSDKLKAAIDAGVVAIHLEEPEFWAYTGFSKAFEREWELYYGEPYVRADSTPDAQYKASRLKYYLYSRTLRRVAESCKEYAKQKYNRDVRMYVPTHSLINYTQWGIVSPQSSLIDSGVIDGCIAQIWTGTSRTPNVYEGRRKERTFETAFLEYGVMQELVRNTGRRMWFLHDPIEDNARHTWDDYRYNYKATLIASLLHPKVWHYEICPWPPRVFEKKYPLNSEDAEFIPPDYATTLCTVFNQLRDMNQPDIDWGSAIRGIGVLMADSAMFQRAEPCFHLAANDKSDPKTAERSEVHDLSGFYGLALPLLKHGIPVQPVQLDNTVRFANYLDGYKVLVVSYEFMKPQSPSMNQALADWTAKGGVLVYVGADTDPFNTVNHWWNSGACDYEAPSEHLMELLGRERKAKEGDYTFGKGHVFVVRKHPAYYTRSREAADEYRRLIQQAAEQAGLAYNECNFMKLERGPYVIAACLEESVSEQPLVLKGLFVDVFDPALPVLEKVTLKPGQRAFLMDLNRLAPEKAQPIASSARIESWETRDNGVLIAQTSTKGVNVTTRLRLPKCPVAMTVNSSEFTDFKWNEQSGTLYFELPPDGKAREIWIGW